MLLLIAVLVPAACLLWFMNAAMRNERFAARQELADLYRSQLASFPARFQQHLRSTAAQLEQWAASNAPPVAFSKAVSSRLVDGLIVFDGDGHIVYPDTPSTVPGDVDEAAWRDAREVEHQRRYADAAWRYEALAREATNASVAARAFQATARNLAQAAKPQAVLELVTNVFGLETYARVADPQGRLIAANVELMALELITNHSSPAFHLLAQRLTARLTDYTNPALAAPQRRFLMKELQRLAEVPFPTLAGEELAAEVLEGIPHAATEFALTRSTVPHVWQCTTPDRRVLALLRSDTVLAAARGLEGDSPAGAQVALVPPDVDAADAFVTLPAGEQMPGWRWTLSPREPRFLNAMAGGRSTAYLWTGILLVGVMAVLTLCTLRVVRRQMTLARLKNDLAATVSHELKTPLSSTRVLVETMLQWEQWDEGKAREYLQLIARENHRLERLIQNFLTFSRMERRKHTFNFASWPARGIIDTALESTRGRFEAPDCRLEVELDGNLPPVMADPDALAAALTNLIENACKYSEGDRRIVLSATADKGSVRFSVKDNGIGLTARERKRIFEPFYQAHPHLARQGGCGLGLSIVRFITQAHQGTVSVESQPGRGSTFTISVPAATSAPAPS